MIDSNSQNISVISSLKNNIRTLVVGRKGCRLKVYVYVQKKKGSKITKNVKEIFKTGSRWIFYESRLFSKATSLNRAKNY